MKKLMLIGGGGHCLSVLDCARSTGEYDEIGIIDIIENEYEGASVIGRDEDIPNLIGEGWKYAFITVGSIGNTSVRHRLFRMVKEMGLIIPTIIDPTAIVCKDSNIGAGTFVGKRAVVNARAEIGECVIINTGAVVEHECEVGSFSHISPGAILCGQVIIGSDVHVGAGSVVKQQVSIGNNSLIGMGSVVTGDIGENVTAYGNPCKVVRK